MTENELYVSTQKLQFMAQEVESATEVLNTMSPLYSSENTDSITTSLAVLLFTIVSVNTHSGQSF